MYFIYARQRKKNNRLLFSKRKSWAFVSRIYQNVFVFVSVWIRNSWSRKQFAAPEGSHSRVPFPETTERSYPNEIRETKLKPGNNTENERVSHTSTEVKLHFGPDSKENEHFASEQIRYLFNFKSPSHSATLQMLWLHCLYEKKI